MPDNLAINIVVNSDKARADLELLKAQLRATNKEVKALGDAGVKAGNTLPSAELQGATARAGALNREIKALNTSLVVTGGEMERVGGSARRMNLNLRNISGSVENLAGAFGRLGGGLAGGLIATAAISGVRLVVQQLDEMVKRLVSIRELAAQTAQRPAVVAAAQRIVQGMGQDADVANKVLTKLSDSFAKAKTAAGAPINTFGVRDLTVKYDEAGNAIDQTATSIQRGVLVLKGGVKPTMDLANALGMLGINADNYKDTQAGMEQRDKDTIKSFLDLAAAGQLGNTQLNELSKTLFDIPSATALEVLPKILANIDKETKDINIDPALAAIKQLEVATGNLKNAWDKQSQDIVIAYAKSLTTAADAANTIIEGGVKGALEREAKLTEESARMQQEASQQSWNAIGAAWDVMLSGMQSSAASTSSAISQIFQSIQVPTAPGLPSPTSPPPMASGGMVAGPGSGTSDSILARLSNGEFVMKARAVEHWGPRFMAALNAMQNPFGYNAGGLVRPRFAAGGMVRATTSHGVTVNLAFPGGSFALQGDNAIVAGLTREAQRAGMLQGGRKAGVLQ